MVLTRGLETACTGRFLTNYFCLNFWGRASGPAEPEPAEPAVGTKPAEPDRPDQKPTRTEPNRPFPDYCSLLARSRDIKCSAPLREARHTWPQAYMLRSDR